MTQDIPFEIERLLEAMYQKYGYDFRNYATASVERVVRKHVSVLGLTEIAQLTELIIYERSKFEELARAFSINVTEMYRDPLFYSILRKEVLEYLKTWPFVRIWVAGCASGEEVYSLAILLKEAEVYDRCQIYATDFNPSSIDAAKQGIFSSQLVKSYTTNYQKSGGKHSFSDYYIAKHGSVLLDPSLRENIIFSQHNLVTDDVFNVMQLITCRNVMIYFNNQLKNRVINLFHESLDKGGFLCLGLKESLVTADLHHAFVTLSKEGRIYQKKFH